MSRGATQATNHPEKGASIKVEPIRKKVDISRIKHYLKPKPRDYCLFVLGINTAYRANELLSLKYKDVVDLEVGDVLEIKQSKVKKYRGVTLNRNSHAAIQLLLDSHKYKYDDYLFFSQRGEVLTVSALNRLVKKWCSENGLRGNYGSHSLRKTWGYQQRVMNKAPVPLLMEAFGHTTQKQTLDYLGIQAREIKQLYDLEL